MKTKAPALLVCFAILLACKVKQPRHLLSLQEYATPPGTTKLAENLYIDQNEVVNLSYVEFLYWSQHVYGKTSEDYLSLLPKEEGWFELGKNYYRLRDWYLHHAAYRSYPVVNISYSQALAFSKWRSDRVMEFTLIRKGILEHSNPSHKDSAFTIEKYFKGEYKGIKPNPFIRHYPWYSLPDSLQFIAGLKLQDSLQKLTSRYFKRKNINVTPHCLENISGKNDTLPYGFDPTRLIWYADEKEFMKDLLGNTSEMTSTKGISFGGSYRDSCTSKSLYLYPYTGSNCYTGFRNICSYKEWKNE